MKNYRNPARNFEIKCRDCDFSFRHPLRKRLRCCLTHKVNDYAVAEGGTCDEAVAKKTTGGGEE